MAVLDRNAILEAKDLPTETVDVPEWGGQVIVRTLTGEERDQYESSMFEVVGDGANREVIPKMENLRATLAALSIVDEDSKRMFDVSEVHLLGQKSAAALDRVFDVAKRLSGLSEEDVKELMEGLDETQYDGTLTS